MNFLRNFFNRFRLRWRTSVFLSDYGPDFEEVKGGGMPLADACRVAVKKWSEEGFTLLPHRYQTIIRQLISEGHCTQEESERRNDYALVIIGRQQLIIDRQGNPVDPNSDELLQPWDKKGVWEKLPEPLQEKISQYEDDFLRFMGSTEVALFWMSGLRIPHPPAITIVS